MKKWIIIGVLGLLLCACGRGREDTARVRVSVLRGPSAIALAGWLEHPPVINGKKTVVRIVDSPEQMQALMIKGETDIAALPMINAANMYNKGLDYLLCGCPVWGNLYLVGKPDARRLHIFASGTTPDILTRYYLEKNREEYTLNYTLQTASEITRGLLSGKVEAAVLGEPFVGKVLRSDTTFHLLADLNNPQGASPGFAETAIVLSSGMKEDRSVIDSLLLIACRFATEQPETVIRYLESHAVFPPGLLTPESIGRCKIGYRTAAEAKDEIVTFLRIIESYEPRAIGGKLPEEGFYL